LANDRNIIEAICIEAGIAAFNKTSLNILDVNTAPCLLDSDVELGL
jgi:hypothetical protein